MNPTNTMISNQIWRNRRSTDLNYWDVLDNPNFEQSPKSNAGQHHAHRIPLTKDHCSHRNELL